MKKKASSSRFWLCLAIFSLTGQIAWVVENMYFNVFLYKMFHADAAAIGTMVALSAVSATLTTVLMGALSDRLGKRKLFIWLGYLLWGASIFSFVFLKKENLEALSPGVGAASLGISLTIFLDCVM
ncbi:MAG: MFS transporter, partial [Clostridia bacterium]|nr:MFS transporter [Clostridia bacterium]